MTLKVGIDGRRLVLRAIRLICAKCQEPFTGQYITTIPKYCDACRVITDEEIIERKRVAQRHSRKTYRVCLR